MFSEHDKAMWKCLVLVAFFGLMRVSEYVCPTSSSFDPSLHLSAQDIHFQPGSNLVSITIKASIKQIHSGPAQVRLVAIGNAFCPVMAIKRYHWLKGLRLGPFFVFLHGDLVTWRFVSAFVCISLPHSIDLDMHSFRIGGASAAASCGVTDSTIKILGRWTSDCYRRYLVCQMQL